MKRNKTIRTVTFLTIALFALSLIATNVNAYTFPRSSNVAMVPDNASSNGGLLYTGSAWPDGLTFTFSNLSPATIRDAATDPLSAYDTVMLLASDFNFATYWANPTFSSRITNFVSGGGKLIIYVTETSYYTAFASFIYPFTITNPGQTGSSGGTLVNVADDTLSSSSAAADTYPNGLRSYINLGLVVSQTDAVGDLSVMTSFDPNWYIDMTGINVAQKGGPAHTYAFYGSGLIIFNGLDIDYGSSSYPPSNSAGSNAIQMIWWRELCAQTLGAGQSVSGLTLTPATATNTQGEQHTVTATVKDTINNPMQGVVVTFTIISGPNTNLTGQATTNANGQATFSWSGAVPGTDTIQASIPKTGGGTVTTTATKTWVPGTVIPEVPLGAIMATAGSFAALGAFYFNKRRRFHL